MKIIIVDDADDKDTELKEGSQYIKIEFPNEETLEVNIDSDEHCVDIHTTGQMIIEPQDSGRIKIKVKRY